jgi:hypothetical protein
MSAPIHTLAHLASYATATKFKLENNILYTMSTRDDVLKAWNASVRFSKQKSTAQMSFDQPPGPADLGAHL